MDYEGWTEEELLAREAELEDEIELLESARDFEYLLKEGFISVEEIDGEYYVFPEELPSYIPVPAPV